MSVLSRNSSIKKDCLIPEVRSDISVAKSELVVIVKIGTTPFLLISCSFTGFLHKKTPTQGLRRKSRVKTGLNGEEILLTRFLTDHTV